MVNIKKLDFHKLLPFLPLAATPPPNKNLLGINCTASGACNIAEVSMTDSKISCQIKNITLNMQTKTKELADFVKQYGLKDKPCSFVLNALDYQYTMIETPNVNTEELSQAIKWAIKDLIDYPLSDAIIDFFPLPLQRGTDKKNMIYAIAIKKSLMLDIYNFIQGASLNLQYIDIPELAIRNIATLHEEINKGLLFITLKDSGGNIVLCKNYDLIISRRFDLNLKELSTLNPENPNEQFNNLLEELTVDIQRSMDFCTNLFRQCPVHAIVLMPSKFDNNFIKAYLESHTGIQVININLTQYINLDTDVNAQTLSYSINTIGTALRNIINDRKKNATN